MVIKKQQGNMITTYFLVYQYITRGNTLSVNIEIRLLKKKKKSNYQNTIKTSSSLQCPSISRRPISNTFQTEQIVVERHMTPPPALQFVV